MHNHVDELDVMRFFFLVDSHPISTAAALVGIALVLRCGNFQAPQVHIRSTCNIQHAVFVGKNNPLPRVSPHSDRFAFLPHSVLIRTDPRILPLAPKWYRQALRWMDVKAHIAATTVSSHCHSHFSCPWWKHKTHACRSAAAAVAVTSASTAAGVPVLVRCGVTSLVMSRGGVKVRSGVAVTTVGVNGIVRSLSSRLSSTTKRNTATNAAMKRINFC
jgi:hypothetical protein